MKAMKVVACWAICLCQLCGCQPNYDPSANRDKRREAIKAASRGHGDRSAMRQLIHALRKDPDIELRKMAMGALVKFPFAQVVNALAETAIAYEELRPTALDLISKIRTPYAAQRLVSLWKHPTSQDDKDFNFLVEMHLGDMGEVALPALRAALRHSSPDIRYRIIRTLELVARSAAIPDIELLLDDPDAQVRRQARLAIENLRSSNLQ